LPGHAGSTRLAPPAGRPARYASALYAALRELDQAGADLIVVEEIPATPAWAAVADRLRRAACGAGLGTDLQS
jgi:L-threonylcarbamoyladenylate synthase